MDCQLTTGSTHRLSDVESFLDLLGRLDQHPAAAVRDLFTPGAELVVTRAPGRLDLMGGIADYSGSLVLQLPLREATRVALQRDPERVLQIVSLAPAPGDPPRVATVPLPDPDSALDYEAWRARFQERPEEHWAAYVAGVFLVLMREKGVCFSEGARILIHSDVPEGKGVSSSAALEVGVMQAVAAAFDLPLAGRELALLCQVAENRVAGAPCGVMDQMTATCGQAGELLALLCQPAELLPPVPLPEELAVWGLDSGERHHVGGADYGAVRAAAFMGYRMIADLAGLEVECRPDGTIYIDDPAWNGYLANLPPSLFEQQFARFLPEAMRGDDFLTRYGGTPDPLTRIAPERSYRVRAATAHPVYEHFRVRAFAELLAGPPGERQRELLGELMYQSHASYSACGLGSPGTDRLVTLAREAGPSRGLYGAKITGGGSGGTVAVLGKPASDAAVAAIASQYAEETGSRPRAFSGSSPGAGAFGHLRLVPE